MAVTQTQDGTRYFLCSSLTDDICKAASDIRSIAYLAPCEGVNQINCVESLFAVNQNGETINGHFVKFLQLTGSYQYSGLPEANLPEGKGLGSIWQIPGITNSAGNENYYLSSYFQSWASVPQNRDLTNLKFKPTNMITSITPVYEEAGAFGINVPLDSRNVSSDGSPNGGVGGMNTSRDISFLDCTVTDFGTCYMATDFPNGIRFGIKLRLSVHLTGWFHGRMTKPEIGITNENQSIQLISIEAFPVSVPTVREVVSTASLTDDLRNFLLNNSVGNSGGYVIPPTTGRAGLAESKLWLPVVKDKSTASRTYWSVKTLSDVTDQTIQKCTQANGDLSGIVTTNAMVYDAGPPVFDKFSGSLSYTVLSPHFTQNGSTTIGTYDLSLASSVARCIYKFKDAPIRASISVVSQDGEVQVATETVNESKNWLKLSASGFTYSSPTISVKLTQDAPTPTPSVTATETPTPKPTAKTLKEITCVKGGKSKKISGVNPRCPTGYKKK
jgi:hypothetical protein